MQEETMPKNKPDKLSIQIYEAAMDSALEALEEALPKFKSAFSEALYSVTDEAAMDSAWDAFDEALPKLRSAFSEALQYGAEEYRFGFDFEPEQEDEASSDTGDTGT